MNIYTNYWKVDSSNPKPKYLMENVSRLFDVKMELGFEKTKNTWEKRPIVHTYWIWLKWGQFQNDLEALTIRLRFRIKNLFIEEK